MFHHGRIVNPVLGYVSQQKNPKPLELVFLDVFGIGFTTAGSQNETDVPKLVCESVTSSKNTKQTDDVFPVVNKVL